MRIHSAARIVYLLVLVTLAACSGPPSTAPQRSAKEQKVVTGEFASPAGAEGPIGFGCEFDTSPKVVFSAPFGFEVAHTYVSDVTKTGFTWKNNGSKEKNESDLHVKWMAEGT